MAFKLVSSESLEQLSNELSINLYSGVSSVLDMPRIIIQSAGMKRWLSLRIAENIGVVAGVEFYFLNGFFQDIIVSAYARDQSKEFDILSIEHLKWLIFSILEDVKDNKAFKVLQNYIQGDIFKRFQLANKLAEIYDKYTLYRTDWLQVWAEYGAEGYNGEYRDGLWLAELWRIIKSRTKLSSLAELSYSCITWLETCNTFSASPVHLFGVSSMPPLYLQVLTQASSKMDVYFYYLEVSHEYWGLVRSEKELFRRAGSNYEEGNSLLATFGERNKDFHNLLTNYAADNGFIEQENVVSGNFDDITDKSLPLLKRIQSGIRFMTQPVKKSIVELNDNSVQFHSCFGKMRQVQALYQTLLDCFNNDKSLKPKDILVLTPSIKEFIPYIKAVFGSIQKDSNSYIPYTISDRAVIDDNKICRSLLSVLKLFSGRFKVSEVWDVYSEPIFYENNGSDPEDLEDVFRWLNKLQVHWGIDGKQKKRYSGLADNECTWKEAEERLLLGYALGASDQLFELHDGRELIGVEVATSIRALENWLKFLSRIFDFNRRYGRLSKSKDWLEFTKALLETFYFEAGAMKQDVLLTLNQLEKVFNDVDVADKELSFDVFLNELSSAFENTTSGAGFIMGGVTFCQFQPMRNIPSKIICMLGMDEGSFPRIIKPLTLDIATREKRLCDPSLKHDDQGVFLETILSVYEKLFIFYSGFGVKKGEELAPAAPIEILRDYIDRYYYGETSSEEVLKQLTIEHPLQSFSNKYFINNSDNKLISYSREDHQVAQKINSSIIKEKILPPIIDNSKICDFIKFDPLIIFSDLVKFYSSPCKYYLQQICNIYFDSTDDILPSDTDRLVVDKGFKLHEIKEVIFNDRLNGVQKNKIYSSIEARRLLPVGYLGSDAFESIYDDVDKLADLFSGVTISVTDEYTGNFDLNIYNNMQQLLGSVSLEYVLKPFSDFNGIRTNISYHFSNSASLRSIIIFWLEHLVFSAVCDDDDSFESHLYNGAGELEFAYSNINKTEARKVLSDYILGYSIGHFKPLPLFKSSSLIYAKQRTSTKAPKDENEAVITAISKYKGTGLVFEYPDSNDLYIAKCFGQDFSDCLDNKDDFIFWSEKLVVPAFENNQAKELRRQR